MKLTIKIPTIQDFWLWVMRFSYKNLKDHSKELPLGIPQLRDIDNPCGGFKPIGTGWISEYDKCHSDGHFLCQECVHFYDEYSEAEKENPHLFGRDDVSSDSTSIPTKAVD